jgi:hypothetical protein
MVYLEERKTWIDYTAYEIPELGRRIKLTRRGGIQPRQNTSGERWEELVIQNFAKVMVTCKCSDKPPINVKLELQGPWKGSNGNYN